MTRVAVWVVLISFWSATTGCAIVPVVTTPPVVVPGPRTFHVPPGHYPPPGHCRLWYPDRPPGHQPPPVSCDRLVVAPGAFILYNAAAWDTDYDWEAHARRHPGSVPGIIIQLTIKR